jgi:hypothetical protein
MRRITVEKCEQGCKLDSKPHAHIRHTQIAGQYIVPLPGEAS